MRGFVGSVATGTLSGPGPDGPGRSRGSPGSRACPLAGVAVSAAWWRCPHCCWARRCSAPATTATTSRAAARPTTPPAPPRPAVTPRATRPRPRPTTRPTRRDAPAGSISTNVKRKTDVPVSTLLTVFAKNGRLSTVTVSGSGDVGAARPARSPATAASGRPATCSSPARRTPSRRASRGDDGDLVAKKQQFTTQALSLSTSRPTRPSRRCPARPSASACRSIVTFDVPVTDRANIEKHLHVTTTPQQPGTWHWLSDNEVHYRPKKYWKAGTEVDVDVDINGVDAGNGIYGQEDRDVQFQIGDAHIYKVDAKTDQMKVFSNGKLLRTIPITTGQQPTYTTRSGIKVIIEKFDSQAHELRDRRHHRRRRLRHQGRPVGHAGDLLRRVRPRRAVVRRLPGPRQRLPRLHRHEHLQRRLALPHEPSAATSSTTPAPTARWTRPTATATGTSPGTSTSRAPRSPRADQVRAGVAVSVQPASAVAGAAGVAG